MIVCHLLCVRVYILSMRVCVCVSRSPLEDSKTLPDTSVRPLAVVGYTPSTKPALGSVCHFMAERHHSF